MSSKIEQIENKTCYAIALRGAVLFPGISTSFELSRKASVKAMREAESTGSEIFIVTQKDSSVVEPKDADLFRTGVVARIVHTIKLSNGNWQLMVEGLSRAELVSFSVDESGTRKSPTLRFMPILSHRRSLSRSKTNRKFSISTTRSSALKS